MTLVISIVWLVIGLAIGWFAASRQAEREEIEQRVDDVPVVPTPMPQLATVLLPDELHFERPVKPDTILWGNVPYYRPTNATTRLKFRNCSDDVLRAIARQTQHQLDVVNSPLPVSSTDYKRCMVAAELTGGFVSSCEESSMDFSNLNRTDVDLEIAFDVHDVKLYLDEPDV